ncbi:MAG TPA: hypothetical protein VGH23_19155 [Rhizomicrobium sp.]|jgi:hypothetical protein
MPETNRPPSERLTPVLKPGPALTGTTPAKRRTRFLAGAFTVVVHIGALALLLLPRGSAPPSHVEPTSEPIQVSLLDTPKPQPPGPPDVDMAAPEAAAAPPLPHFTTRATVQAAVTPKPDNSDLLSDSQLAGAASAGEGGGGGGGSCDLARAVQQALRRDPMVRAAAENANRLGKSVMLWNGDWVRSGGEDGKGLSAVREAVTWEVAFAPQACRNQRMHGLVLLSLTDGRTRFAIGGSDWRWADLLSVRGATADR